MINTALLAATQGGRYANAAVLLILGLFVLFLAYAVAQRTSLPVDVHDDDELVDRPAVAQWIEGERRRARLATAMRPLLIIVGVALLSASALAALISWL
ncbi:MAG: hypothetical protein HKL85_11115 [Acidimicrobiaceae bacterium]|nr:hypothetical protein [Acidimicrobiaceae bacterium]